MYFLSSSFHKDNAHLKAHNEMAIKGPATPHPSACALAPEREASKRTYGYKGHEGLLLESLAKLKGFKGKEQTKKRKSEARRLAPLLHKDVDTIDRHLRELLKQ